jgi:hypothetical protein
VPRPGENSIPPAAPRSSRAAGAKTAFELFVNIGAPWLVYTLLAPRYGDFWALVASAAPPTLWSLYELARYRVLDALSLLVLGGIALSLLAMGLGGSPRMLLVRENIFSVPIGLAFLLSLGLRRPLIYYLATATMARNSGERLAEFEANWQRPHVLRGLRIMSLVWGLGLVAQGVFLSWAAWTWPIATYLLVSPAIGYGAIGAMALWNWRYVQELRRTSEAMQHG